MKSKDLAGLLSAIGIEAKESTSLKDTVLISGDSYDVVLEMAMAYESLNLIGYDFSFKKIVDGLFELENLTVHDKLARDTAIKVRQEVYSILDILNKCND